MRPIRPSVEQTSKALSVPPVKWADAQTVVLAPPEAPPAAWKELAQAVVWGALNPERRERFRSPTTPSVLDSLTVTTEDGWTVPLLRRPAFAGASGEPIILASSAHLSPESMDAFAEDSLVHALHGAGYDVFLFRNRGCRQAVRPQGIATFDFDDMIAHDVPATIDEVRRITGAPRVAWLGHGLGGQLLVGLLGSRVSRSIAAGVVLGSPVQFRPLGTTARRAAAVARALPSHWRLPLQRVQRLLTVASRPMDVAPLSRRLAGPRARGLMMDCGTDIAMGLAQQVALWHEVGHLVDRDNRFDYVAGLAGLDTPMMTVAASGDPMCSPAAAKPVHHSLIHPDRALIELGHDWSHLDLIAGSDAATQLFPQIIAWLESFRSHCWTSE